MKSRKYRQVKRPPTKCCGRIDQISENEYQCQRCEVIYVVPRRAETEGEKE